MAIITSTTPQATQVEKATVNVTTKPTDKAMERYNAALARIQGSTPQSDASNIDSKGSPLNANEGGGHTPQGSKGEEPINDLNAKAVPDQKDTQIDPKVAELANREKAAWAEIKKLKADKASLEQASKQAEGKITKEEALKMLRTNPESLGLTATELGEIYLSLGQPVDPSTTRLQAKIEELEAKLNDSSAQAKTAQESAYKQALAQIEREAKTLVSKNDAYEVTRSQGAESAITNLIELTYQETGELMGVEEAAAQVEAHLEAEAIALFNKSAKLKGKLMPVEAKEAPGDGQSPMKHQQVMQKQTTTLTPALTQASTKPMSSRERAIAAFLKHSR